MTSEIEIAAAPQAVWDVLMDPHRLADWVTTHHSLDDEAPHELSEGSTFKQALKVKGPKFEVTWKVIEADCPRRVVWEGEGPAGSSAGVVYELEASGPDSTRFRYENEFELPGGRVSKLAGKRIGAATAKREAERSLANLKALVED